MLHHKIKTVHECQFLKVLINILFAEYCWFMCGVMKCSNSKKSGVKIWHMRNGLATNTGVIILRLQSLSVDNSFDHLMLNRIFANLMICNSCLKIFLSIRGLKSQCVTYYRTLCPKTRAYILSVLRRIVDRHPFIVVPRENVERL